MFGPIKRNGFPGRRRLSLSASCFVLLVLSFLINPLSCYIGDVSEVEQESVIEPKINLRAGLLTLSSGGTYDYGKVVTGNSRSMQFVVENLGKDYLALLGNPLVEVSGTDASMFVVTSQPSTPIAPFTYRNFTIIFTPATDFAKTAEVTIRNSDPDAEKFIIYLTGEGDPNIAPEINLRQGVTDIASGTGSYSFGSTQVGTPVGPTAFTIQNTGTANLIVSGVTLTGPDAGSFIINTLPSSPVVAAGSTTFEVTFDPVSAGSKTATITVANDDSDESSYTFTITGTGTAVPVQDIHVTQSSTYLPDGSGDYSFGSINQGDSSATIQFTITNNGTAGLDISGFTNSNVVDFNAVPPTLIPIAPSGTRTFTIAFTPMSDGLRTSTITINNNDPDENPYTFTVRGTGVAIPEMDLFQGATAVVSEVYSHTFGPIPSGSTQDVIFTINNTGLGALELPATDRVEITGDAEFSIFALPGTPIAGGGSDTFTVRFNPLDVGSYAAIISISNNDSDENPYIFDITGSATAVAVPEIEVLQLTTPVLHGSTYDAGGMTVGAAPINNIFTVKNIGSANLTVSGVIKGGPDAGDYTLNTAMLTSPVGAGGSTTFEVAFNPATVGSKTATISINNNDTDENPYVFTIKAVGTSPEMNLKQGVTNIASGVGSFDFGSVNLTSSSQVDFTIENTSGTSALFLTGSPMVTLAGSPRFTVVQQPPSSTIGPSLSEKFSIRYSPTGTAGDTATVTILSNDKDSPYTFIVNGQGVNPNIVVRNDTPADIASGGSFDFGNIKYTLSPARTFTINNTGTVGDLKLLSTPRVIVSGANASFFQVTQPGTDTIAAGGNTPFQITFNPTNVNTPGLRSASVSIFSNDADLPVHSFTVNGTVGVPDINIREGVTDLTNGVGSYDFGNFNKGSTSAEITFTIQNTGDADLALSGGPNYVVLSNSADFHITAQAASGTIAPLGSTTFKLTYNPQSLGLHTSTVTVVSDDPDAESNYTFTITGTGIDTEAPVVNVTSPLNGTHVKGNPVPVNATATDNVGVVQVEFFIDGLSIGSDAAAPYTVDWDTTASAEGARAVRADATDAGPPAVNTGTDNDTTVTVDNIAPTINITGPVPAQANSSGSVDYTVTYADVNFSTATLVPADITLNLTGGVTASKAVSGGPTVWTVTLTNITGNGTVGITVAAGKASDVAGNTDVGASSAVSVIADNIAPTINITGPVPAQANSSGSVDYTVTYADANFDTASLAAADITLNPTGGVTANKAVSGGPTVWTVTLTNITGNGTVGITVAAGKASDLAGNTDPGASSAVSVIADNTAPTINITGPVPAQANSSGSVDYTVTYADANFNTASLAAADITLNPTGGVTASKAVSGGPTVWTVTLTNITGNGTVGITVAAGKASDLAGNTDPGASSAVSVIADNTAPTINITGPVPAQANSSGSVDYTVTYADANFNTASLAAADITLNPTGGVTASKAVSGGPTVWTVTLTNISGNGTVGITVAAGKASDLAGNTDPGASSAVSVIADNTAPTINITGPVPAQANSSGSVDYTVTYADANFNTASLAAADITLNPTGGVTASKAVSGGPTVWTVTLTNISGNGTVGITVAAGKASDLAGNTDPGASSAVSVIADNTPPTVTITGPPAGNADGTEALTFTVSDGTIEARISTGTWEIKASGVIINTLSGWGPPANGTNFTVEVRSTDAAGNIGTDTRTFTKI